MVADLLTITDLAEATGVKKGTLVNLIKQNFLTPIYPGSTRAHYSLAQTNRVLEAMANSVQQVEVDYAGIQATLAARAQEINSARGLKIAETRRRNAGLSAS